MFWCRNISNINLFNSIIYTDRLIEDNTEDKSAKVRKVHFESIHTNTSHKQVNQFWPYFLCRCLSFGLTWQNKLENGINRWSFWLKSLFFDIWLILSVHCKTKHSLVRVQPHTRVETISRPAQGTYHWGHVYSVPLTLLSIKIKSVFLAFDCKSMLMSPNKTPGIRTILAGPTQNCSI